MSRRERYAPGAAFGAQVRKRPEGASGWHICFDVLDRWLAGEPLGRIAGPDAVKVSGWQRLNAEYAEQLGVQTPK